MRILKLTLFFLLSFNVHAQTSKTNEVSELIYKSRIALKSNNKDLAIRYAKEAHNIAEMQKSNFLLIAQAKGNYGYILYELKEKQIDAIILLEQATKLYYKHDLKQPEFLIYQRAFSELQKNDGADKYKQMTENSPKNEQLNSLIDIESLSKLNIDIQDTVLIRVLNENKQFARKRNILTAFNLWENGKWVESLKIFKELTLYYIKNKDEIAPIIINAYNDRYNERHKEIPPELCFWGIQFDTTSIIAKLVHLEVAPNGDFIYYLDKTESKELKRKNGIINDLSDAIGGIIKSNVSVNHIALSLNNDLLDELPTKNIDSLTNLLGNVYSIPIQINKENIIRENVKAPYFYIGNDYTTFAYRKTDNTLKENKDISIIKSPIFNSKSKNISFEHLEKEAEKFTTPFSSTMNEGSVLNSKGFYFSGELIDALITVLESSIGQEKMTGNLYYLLDVEEIEKLCTFLENNYCNLSNPSLWYLIGKGKTKEAEYQKRILDKTLQQYGQHKLLFAAYNVKNVINQLTNLQESKKAFFLTKGTYFYH